MITLKVLQDQACSQLESQYSVNDLLEFAERNDIRIPIAIKKTNDFVSICKNIQQLISFDEHVIETKQLHPLKDQTLQHQTSVVDLLKQKTDQFAHQEEKYGQLGLAVPVKKLLGEGGFGRVYLLQHPKLRDRSVVVKEIDKTKNNRDLVLREVEALKEIEPFCSSFFLCYKGFLEDSNKYYIYTQFLKDYMTLEDYIQSTDVSDMLLTSIFYNLVKAIQVLHNQANIAHLDLKPPNIMIHPKTGQIKIIDFGGACVPTPKQNCVLSGISAAYLSPELASTLNDPNEVSISLEAAKKADLWALGMTLFTVLAKTPLPLLFAKKLQNHIHRFPFYYVNPTVIIKRLNTSDPIEFAYWLLYYLEQFEKKPSQPFLDIEPFLPKDAYDIAGKKDVQLIQNLLQWNPKQRHL